MTGTESQQDEGPVDFPVVLKFKTRNDFDVYRMMAAAERHTDENYATALVYEMLHVNSDGDAWIDAILSQTSWKQEEQKEFQTRVDKLQQSAEAQH